MDRADMLIDSRSDGSSDSAFRPRDSDRQSICRPSSVVSATGMKSRKGTMRPDSSMMRISPS